MGMRQRVSMSALAISLLASFSGPAAVGASDQISYESRPDELAIFLNGIAYAKDTVSFPSGVEARVVLPDTAITDTLVLREDGVRVPTFRIDRRTGKPAVSWRGTSGAEVREVSLEYLLSGTAWQPAYDLWLGADRDETVGLDFLAQIQDSSLYLDDVHTRLVAGRVDYQGGPAPVAELAAQRFDDSGVGGVSLVSLGQAEIQHVYDIGRVNAEPGDTIFLEMTGGVRPAHRRHVWQAQSDSQVAVIYEITNNSELPFANGVVRTYQGGLFIGTGAIELTPVGSDGHVTVGHLQDVRVERQESRTAINLGRFDYRNEVELTLDNFSEQTLEIEVVEIRRPEAEQLESSMVFNEEPGNVMRWTFSIEPGETRTINYTYLVD